MFKMFLLSAKDCKLTQQAQDVITTSGLGYDLVTLFYNVFITLKRRYVNYVMSWNVKNTSHRRSPITLYLGTSNERPQDVLKFNVLREKTFVNFWNPVVKERNLCENGQKSRNSQNFLFAKLHAGRDGKKSLNEKTVFSFANIHWTAAMRECDFRLSF